MWEPTTSPASQSLLLMGWRSRAGCSRLILLLSIIGLDQTNQPAVSGWSQTGGVGQGGTILRPAQVRDQFDSNSSSISQYRMKFIMYLWKTNILSINPLNLLSWRFLLFQTRGGAGQTGCNNRGVHREVIFQVISYFFQTIVTETDCRLRELT